MAPMPPAPPRAPDLEETFTGSGLDPGRWVDHYLPQWTTPDRSRARYALTAAGLELRIEADQPDWRPQDPGLRVSNLQTATFSGPAGSSRGTHRHRPDGLLVRTPQPTRVLWAPHAGRVDVTVSASTDPGCMLAVWLVGTEHLAAEDSGEICLVEIDADAIGPTSRVRVGVKAHHDPRLRTEMTEVEVPLRADRPHTWSAQWTADGVLIGCDGVVVHRCTQVLAYPLQLMVDLFELGPRDRFAADSYPKRGWVHRVAGWDLGPPPAG